jgi:hypothetical protein
LNSTTNDRPVRIHYAASASASASASAPRSAHPATEFVGQEVEALWGDRKAPPSQSMSEAKVAPRDPRVSRTRSERLDDTRPLLQGARRDLARVRTQLAYDAIPVRSRQCVRIGNSPHCARGGDLAGIGLLTAGCVTARVDLLVAGVLVPAVGRLCSMIEIATPADCLRAVEYRFCRPAGLADPATRDRLEGEVASLATQVHTLEHTTALLERSPLPEAVAEIIAAYSLEPENPASGPQDAS